MPKSKEKPVPYHNEPSKQSAWYIWVVLAVVACAIVSFSIFSPLFGIAVNPAEKEEVNPIAVIEVQENPLKPELEKVESLQNELTQTLAAVKIALQQAESKNLGTEQQIQNMANVTEGLALKLEALENKPQETVIAPVKQQETANIATLLLKKAQGKLTAVELQAVYPSLNEASASTLKAYESVLVDGKNTSKESVIFAFYNAYMQDSPKKPNLITYDKEQNALADKAKQVLAKFVHISKADPNSSHTLNWQEAMLMVEQHLQQFKEDKALEVLNASPLVSDARLDTLRTLISRYIAGEALWNVFIATYTAGGK